MNAAQLTGLDLPATKHAPLTWLQADSQASAFRACFFCVHGTGEGQARVCTNPLVLGPSKPQPIAIARAWGGGCGPDAYRMAQES